MWTGTLFKKRGGYGSFWDVDQKIKRAHRVAWELATGDTLTPEEHVLHRCDNPPCVRFKHLRLGDQAKNMEDMTTKGRGVQTVHRGQDQYRAKLTDEVVLDARRRYAAGEEIRDIAVGSVSPAAIKAAIYGKSWRHVPMPSYENRERRIGEKAKSCPQGHWFTEENTAYVTDKQGYRIRYCKQCNRDRANAHAALKRAARNA